MNTPKLAIIVPCYNEELCIKKTAEKLLEVLDYLIKSSKICMDRTGSLKDRDF